VAAINKAGIDVELAPGVRGFAHISELSNAFVQPGSIPSMFSVGQQIPVRVLGVGPGKREGDVRIQLSVKSASSRRFSALPIARANAELPRIEARPLKIDVPPTEAPDAWLLPPTADEAPSALAAWRRDLERERAERSAEPARESAARTAPVAPRESGTSTDRIQKMTREERPADSPGIRAQQVGWFRRLCRFIGIGRRR